jgi:hypothetical protein
MKKKELELKHNWKATGLRGGEHEVLGCWIEYKCSNCKKIARDYYHTREVMWEENCLKKISRVNTKAD